MDPQAPILVPRQPPQNLQEVPPAERPAGASVVWVPGYWLQAGNGWEWIGGFWKPIGTQPQPEIQYLPAPPAPVEVQAPGAPPQPDQVWVPGCWYWSQGHYIIRHGYWIRQQVGWVWVPSHFACTPRGYIFAEGHWDHDLDNRGVLFCPAFFPPEVRVRAGFVFSPAVCVDLGVLRLNLFVYPQYRHYYFGDYYDDAYARLGIMPWFKCQTVHTWYDPLFVYDRWHFQQIDPHWAANLAKGFDLRRSHRDLRPAHTYPELQAQYNRLPANRRPERPLVEPIKTFAVSEHTPVKFERIAATERQQIAVKAADVRGLRDQRTQWEAPASRPAAVPAPAAKKRAPVKIEAPSRAAATPAPRTRATGQVPPPQVRVTQPEKVAVQSTPRMPQPAESRFIQKVPPSHPAQEQLRTAPEPGSNSKSPARESPNRPGSTRSPGRDRQN